MNNGTRRIDRLFDFALVMLGVLSASEFQFVCSVPGREAEIPYAFRILTYPMVVLIILWLVKEVSFSLRPGHASFKMAYREFCWDLWASTLYMYLLLYLLFALGSVGTILAILFAILSFLLAGMISIGYEHIEPGMVYFRRRQRRIVRSIFLFALAFGFVWLFIIP